MLSTLERRRWRWLGCLRPQFNTFSNDYLPMFFGKRADFSHNMARRDAFATSSLDGSRGLLDLTIVVDAGVLVNMAKALRRDSRCVGVGRYGAMLLAALSIQRIADEAGACEVLWCAEGAANNGSLYDLQTRVFRRVEAYGLAHWARARLARGETSAVAVAERLRERGRHAVTVGEDVVDLATHDAASRAYTLKPPSGCNVWEAALLEAIGGGARIEESTFSCEPLASPPEAFDTSRRASHVDRDVLLFASAFQGGNSPHDAAAPPCMLEYVLASHGERRRAARARDFNTLRAHQSRRAEAMSVVLAAGSYIHETGEIGQSPVEWLCQRLHSRMTDNAEKTFVPVDRAPGLDTDFTTPSHYPFEVVMDVVDNMPMNVVVHTWFHIASCVVSEAAAADFVKDWSPGNPLPRVAAPHIVENDLVHGNVPQPLAHLASLRVCASANSARERRAALAAARAGAQVFSAPANAPPGSDAS